MERQKHSLQQVSVALLYSALSLEYYMNETYRVYEDVKGVFPDWIDAFNQVENWALEESFRLGLSSNQLEEWGDELLLKDFKPIADSLAEKNQIIGGKLAFMALFLSLVLEMYLKIPTALGKEQVHHLLAQLKEYLQERWQTDLDGEIINPDLSSLHVPMARDFAERWQQQVESLSNKAS